MSLATKLKVWAAIILLLAVLILWVKLGTDGFVTLLVCLVLAALVLRALWWAFMPRQQLPRNRVRCQRFRLFLRLHPGPGFATALELHRHWSRTAAWKRAERVRQS